MIKKILENVYTAAYSDLLVDNEYNFGDKEIVDVRHLVDRSGNKLDYLLQAIENAEQVLHNQRRVVIACDMGISRSRVIAIGLLAKLGFHINDSINRVMELCGYPEINAELILLLKQRFNDHSQNFIIKKDVVILGSGGFIGTALISFLKNEGLVVKGVGRNELDLRIDNIRLIDILQKAEPRAVILCAHPQSHHTAGALGGSLQILKNVLEACRLTNVRLIYISGMVVYSGCAFKAKSNQYVADENKDPTPRGTYSESKFLAEKLIYFYNVNYNLNFGIIRPCGLYGPGMRPEWLIPKLISNALHNIGIKTHRYANGLPKFELLYIDDFCDAVCKLINLENGFKCLNIGSHNLIDTNSLASLITKVTGSKSSINFLDIRDDIYNVVSSSGFIESIGWYPKVSLENGLKKCIEFIMTK